jgi:hypothetical protein
MMTTVGYVLLGLLAGYVLGRFHENRVMQQELEAMAARQLDPASLQRARKDTKNAAKPADPKSDGDRGA